MTYQIADEPLTGEGRSAYIFRPNAPLLAEMLCGTWLSFPWFAFNAWALGAPTSRRQIKMCALALAAVVALAFAIYGLVDVGVIESRQTLRIALLGLDAVKIGLAYKLSAMQARTFEVYTYYGGTVRKATAVIMVGRFVRPLLYALSASPVWHAILF